MAILILGECWPYRNLRSIVDNSQIRFIAQACNLSIEEFANVFSVEYLIEHYVPSHKHHTLEYVMLLRSQWQAKKERYIKYDVVLVIGKRLLSLTGTNALFYTKQHHSPIIGIPNPLAQYYWLDKTTIKQLQQFLKMLLLTHS